MSKNVTARSEFADFRALVPDLETKVRALASAAAEAGLDKALLELVKIRVSQINGCAFCVQFHVNQAEGLSVGSDRLHQLAVWREAQVFSPRERVALAWAEALTLLPQGVGDELYAEASSEFDAKELAYLSSAIAGINVWNRLGVMYRWTPPAAKTR
ncbi:MAG: carboxymuconolactone decarboxylase family protein [Hyphomicrobiales bacterium]|nr:carboxymuconolactone decarboxylase family protein [Hyphomicrobiales bacterium]